MNWKNYKYLIQVTFKVKVILKNMVDKVIYYFSQCTDMKISNTDHILKWKSKGSSDEIIKPPSKNDNNLTSALNYVGNKIRVKFDGSFLKQDKSTYTHRTIINIFIVYELSSNLCLFGAVKLTKNADIDKYKNSGYGIGFDWHRTFSFTNGKFACNIIIFGVDMSSSVHVDNEKR